MVENLVYLFFVLLPVAVGVAGVLVGLFVESSHFRRLEREEQALAHLMISDLRWLPDNWTAGEATLVCGEAAIARDSLKAFLAGVRRIVGGRIRAYETLMERARREAIVRMLHRAQAAGANVVWNVRVSSAALGGEQRQKAFGVLVVAYGTAMKIRAAE